MGEIILPPGYRYRMGLSEWSEQEHEEYGKDFYVDQAFLDFSRKTLTHLQCFPDISILSNRETLRHGQTMSTWGVIPKDYFASLEPQIHPSWTQDLVRFLFAFRKISTKSKLMQAGLSVQPALPSQRAYSTMPVEDIGDSYIAPFELKNINPVKDLVLPQGLNPMLRLFIDPPPLEGQDLVDATLRAGFKNPRFFAYPNPSEVMLLEDDAPSLTKTYTLEEVLSLDKCDSLLNTKWMEFLADQEVKRAEGNGLDPKCYPPSPLAFAILDIVNLAEFKNDGIPIDLAVLPQVPTSDRELLDKVLGLRWENVKHNPPARPNNQIWIGETETVRFPENFAAVINTNLQLTNVDTAHHAASPVIDPLFGANNEEGLPIRVEIETLGIGQYDKEVYLNFYPAKAV